MLVLLSILSVYIPKESSAQNLAVNGDFESGISPWHMIISDPNNEGYTGTLKTTTDAYSGNYAALFTVYNRPTSNSGYIIVGEEISSYLIETEKMYRLEFYYKGTMITYPNVYCFNLMYNSDMTSILQKKLLQVFYGPQCSSTNSWKYMSMIFGPIPQGTACTEIHFDVGSAGSFLFDNFIVTPVESQLQSPQPSSSAQFGFGVYSDQGCNSRISRCDWGTLTPGMSKNMVVYVRNEGQIPIILQKQMLNVNPTNLESYLSTEWDYNGQMLNAGQVLRVLLVLRVTSQVLTINNFSYDFVITASG